MAADSKILPRRTQCVHDAALDRQQRETRVILRVLKEMGGLGRAACTADERQLALSSTRFE